MKRRDFIKGAAVLVAAAGSGETLRAAARMDTNEAKDEGGPLIASAPMLQNFAETSIGIAFAVGALANGYVIYGTPGTAKFFCDNGVPAKAVAWPDEEGPDNVMDLISSHQIELIINVPKNHTKRELTNGYRIRRAAIDHNIPLMTNVRLAKAFIQAFCAMNMEDIQIKSWQEYNA